MCSSILNPFKTSDRLTEKQRCLNMKTRLFPILTRTVLLIGGLIKSIGRQNKGDNDVAFIKISGYKTILPSSTSESDIS